MIRPERLGIPRRNTPRAFASPTCQPPQPPLRCDRTIPSQSQEAQLRVYEAQEAAASAERARAAAEERLSGARGEIARLRAVEAERDELLRRIAEVGSEQYRCAAGRKGRLCELCTQQTGSGGEPRVGAAAPQAHVARRPFLFGRFRRAMSEREENVRAAQADLEAARQGVADRSVLLLSLESECRAEKAGLDAQRRAAEEAEAAAARRSVELDEAIKRLGEVAAGLDDREAVAAEAEAAVAEREADLDAAEALLAGARRSARSVRR